MMKLFNCTLKNNGSSGRGLTGREAVLPAGLMSVLWKKSTQEIAFDFVSWFPINFYGQLFYISEERGMKELENSTGNQKELDWQLQPVLYLLVISSSISLIGKNLHFILNYLPIQRLKHMHKYTNMLFIFVHIEKLIHLETMT